MWQVFQGFKQFIFNSGLNIEEENVSFKELS